MDLFSMFKSAPATPAAATPPGTPAPVTAPNPSAPPTPGTAANGLIPANNAAPAVDNNANKQETSPLDQFSGLWDTAAPKQSETSKFLQMDPTKMMEAVSKVDFSKAITPENLAAITTGGEGAAKAYVDSLNKVAQTVMAQTIGSTTKIMEAALKKQSEEFTSSLPDTIRKHTANESLRGENPIFANPAVQPLIQGLQSQLAVKYPNATAAELNKMAKDYMVTVFGEVAPKPDLTKDANGKPKKQEQDWSAFLS